MYRGIIDMKSRYSSFIYLALFSLLVLNIVSCNINNDKNKINEKPTAYAGEDRNVKLNENIKFTGYGTDSYGFIALYQWDLNSKIKSTTYKTIASQ